MRCALARRGWLTSVLSHSVSHSRNAVSGIMNNRSSPLSWSFPAGTWFSTEVRVSVFFPLLLLVLWWRLGDISFALVFGAILVASVIAHEFGHVVAARFTGGAGDEIVIWPLGGLALVEPANTFSSRLQTAAAGLIVNAMICLLTLPAVLNSEFLVPALNPLVLPFNQFSGQLLEDLLILAFAANWVLFLVNLIPVYPLDGGRMLQACLVTRLSGSVAAAVYLRVGFVVAFLMLIAGLMVDGEQFSGAWIVFIGAIILMLNMQESMQLQAAESGDESFMGYDFSQGYTSLERKREREPKKRVGFLKRWRAKRIADKQRRAREREERIEVELDALLDKVHNQGMDSLTESEKRQLRRASVRYRNKDSQADGA